MDTAKFRLGTKALGRSGSVSQGELGPRRQETNRRVLGARDGSGLDLAGRLRDIPALEQQIRQPDAARDLSWIARPPGARRSLAYMPFRKRFEVLADRPFPTLVPGRQIVA